MACTVVVVAISAYPHATNHQVRIEEAMAGANGDSQIQFVEMRMLDSIQNCWGPLLRGERDAQPRDARLLGRRRALQVPGEPPERQPGTFSNLNSQFSIQNAPTPTNFNGDTLTIPITSQATQGEALFNQESFGGNGRTCASCHVAGLNGGLTPANIATRFGTVSTTFDPLFVGETAATGFDFNLRSMTQSPLGPTPATTTATR